VLHLYFDLKGLLIRSINMLRRQISRTDQSGHDENQHDGDKQQFAHDTPMS
jgi:hypothetical protein